MVDEVLPAKLTPSAKGKAVIGKHIQKPGMELEVPKSFSWLRRLELPIHKKKLRGLGAKLMHVLERDSRKGVGEGS